LCCLQVTYQQQQELLKAQQQAADADARMAEQMDVVMQVSISSSHLEPCM
jgi:hypothetical protein